MEANFKKMDAALPLIFPNPSLGINLTGILFLMGMGLFLYKENWTFLIWFFFLLMGQLSVFLIGIFYTRNRVKNAISIAGAPIFLIWKMAIDIVSALGWGRKTWVRTKRK